MSPKTAPELRAEAERHVAAVQVGAACPEDRAAIVDALTVDLRTADDQALLAADRLEKIEVGLRRLSAAVAAITDAADTIAQAAMALKYDSRRV